MLQRVVRSTVIDAPIERIWAVLRDFNSHDQWHSAIANSHIEGGERSDQVGCIRSFKLNDGSRIREQLLTLSDTDYKSTYCIVEATVPLQHYVATITLKPVTDGSLTFWRWESTFDTPTGLERELHDMVAQGVYETGFTDLQRYLIQGGDLKMHGASIEPMPRALAVPSRKVVVKRYGASDQLTLKDCETPAPKSGEVRIRQRAIGVNYFDVYLRRGLIPSMFAEGDTLGMEAAGTVLDVGDGVHDFLPGDRVAYLGSTPGAYCSVRSVPAAWVLRLPPAVEDVAAAAILLKGITADFLLRDLSHVRAGTRLLVHAAAGGLGMLLCSWASRLGARVIGTVSSEDKARIAREHGCEQVIVDSSYRFADAVLKLWSDGADVIIDSLGQAAREENFAALANCGHWISVGQATGNLPAISPDWLGQKSASFSRPVVFAYVANHAVLMERAQRLWMALADGSIKTPLVERWTLDAAGQAHERLESRRTVGSLVLTI
jgi:NADPH:quinone reductase